MDARVFLSNGKFEEQSQTAEIERESVRDRALLEERDSIGNKIDRYEKHVVQMCEIN
jgi:hypothetical protein